MMTSLNFDDLVSPLSHEDQLDRNWAEVPVPAAKRAEQGSYAPVGSLLDTLEDLYWVGVRQEVAALIVAFDEIQSIHPEATEEEKQARQEADGLLLDNEKDQIINDLLRIWTPVGAPPDEEVDPWTVKHGVAAFLKEPLPKRRARSLLQASGFLDVDICREHRPPSFRSWGQRPHSEQRSSGMINKLLFVAVQCSICRNCIRSLSYYKCVKGCRDCPILRNRVKLQKTERLAGLDIEEDDRMLNTSYTFLMDHLDEPMDYTVCPACLPDCLHPRDHLRAVRHFSTYASDEEKEFARELDDWEDANKGKSLLAMGSIAWEHFVDNALKATSVLPSTRKMFPAGDAHTALMFGPLLIENGVTRRPGPGGAFISLRNPPAFCNSSPKAVEELLAADSAFRAVDLPDGSQEEVVFGTCYSISPKKKLYVSQKPRRQRRWLSFRKQVLGGIFSGYTTDLDRREDGILDEFLQVAERWSTENSTDHSRTQSRDLLLSCADSVVKLLKTNFERDVKSKLLIFADRLMNRVKLQYSRVSNNCQQFCKAMLINGDDWDDQWNTMYPSIPPCLETFEQTGCLRYLMSFAGLVSNPVPEGGKATIMATAVNVFDWFPHTDGADIIDHVASLRFKTDAKGDSPDVMFRHSEDVAHDEILLKSQSTCYFNYKHDRKCTLTAHLLDCPYDNLSILTMHAHRSRSLYTFQSTGELAQHGYETFLSTCGRKPWIANRLGVLLRTFLLHAYLSSMTSVFFSKLPVSVPLTRRHWNPQPTTWSRSRHDVRRDGNVIRLSDQDLRGTPGNTEGNSYPLMQALLASAPFMQSQALFTSRWKLVKKRLKEHLNGENKSSDTPWENCSCRVCNQALAVLNCRRAKAYVEHVQGTGGQYDGGHPDYVSMATLQWSFARLQGHEDKEAAELVLCRVPEYFDVPGSV
ncbi:hypothetical protein QQS21_006031 [Conoideocrella luteorostrata]|uniref:Uncharacterized protein n=1 Tax=Conoideocrella luteorostrata TaxID=1105319 RepID=A0AAJ0CR14_9HYPO|nr:hypothetical protein QQS21_006031 [Conoideocrella luteorostrata]